MNKIVILDHLKTSLESVKKFTGSMVGELAQTVTDAIQELQENIVQVFNFTAGVDWDGWVQSGDAYTKTVFINGLLESDTPIMDVVLLDDVSAAKLQLESYQCINRAVVNNGSITLYCYDEVPFVSFEIQLLVLRGGV